MQNRTQMLEPGIHLAFPQVARLFYFSLEEKAVLITTPDRVRLYESLPVFGKNVSSNPSIADWPTENHVVLDIQTALAAFPKDPAKYRLDLSVGNKYGRDDLLDRLDWLGFERGENLLAAEIEKTSSFFVRGDTIEIKDDKKIRLEFFGDVLETVFIDEQAVKGVILGPVNGFSPEKWDSTRLDLLDGKIYLDSPEFFAGYVSEKDLETFWNLISGREIISFSRISLALPEKAAVVEPLPFYRARLQTFGEDARKWLSDGYSLICVLKHERTADYLTTNILNNLKTSWSWKADQKPGEITLVKGVAEGGFIDRLTKTIVVTEDCLYGFQGGSTLRARKLKGPPVHDATALAIGDYLIHHEHGISQFLGLEAREVLGVTRDYLILRYGGDAKIYLPVEQLPSLRRHPGTTDDPPRLSMLGTNEWIKAREKAKTNAEELAQRLVIQYAARQATPGMAFATVDDWDPLIGENFPFELTPDQKRAVSEVIHDLEKPTPMDRLVSGDVGFGKTEVAVRAAHRVIGNGRQVAILVPTTLLADQHLETFRQRFKGLPVKVAGLSRFTPGKEATTVLKELKEGKVDIVIGTHRLLSGELKFHNLGLLVIDEEHRFGVVQKEKLKALKSIGELLEREKKKQAGIAKSLEAVANNVIGEEKFEVKLSKENAIDVLSMSATPIPRTLYMAMVGLRDISHIATPPVGRKPIRTILTPFDPMAVRDAIMFEIDRGGKTFFIHDRVASIEQRAKYLQSLVPEARIAVAHGQMRDDDIEEVMLGFEEGAFDLLVATTIVESGLDIPEANTILIERADRLGLAQLYQLRGRVGRRAKEAYAYLFYPPRLSEGAERRLWAIADLADLGSGHLLAEKDMEIRGIGNILGSEQHGHIQLVSLEIYTELLAEAIAKLKGEEVQKPQSIRVAIDLAIDARLTPEYLPQESQRIEYYGRLSEAAGLAEISRVEKELKAEHGSLPRLVRNFIDLAKLRVVASNKGVISITENLTHIQVAFSRSALDYDIRVFQEHRNKAEITKYPPGFRLEKRGLKPDEYVKMLLELLYAFL